MLSDKALSNLKNISTPTQQPQPEIVQEVSTKKGLVPVKVVQVGSSGTNIYGGYITEDYLADLRGTKAMKIFDQMRRSDPRIKMCLSAVKNPIKSADWIIEKTSDDPMADKQKAMLEKILFKGLNKSWKKTLHEILSMVDFGHAELEITHKVVLKDKEVGPHIGLKSLKLIGQKTIERFNVNTDGDLISISQFSSGDVGKNVDINGQWLLHFAVDKEGDNYEGVSMLRTCYGPWLRKNNALKQEAVGNQNFSTPIAVMTVPSGMQNTEQYQNAITFLENYTRNLSSYLIKPEGFELELKSNTFDSSKIRETIASENEEITFAFLANFLNLASGGGGSYALSNDLSDFFTSSLEFIAEEIVETMNMCLIPELVKLNFADAECMVKLSVSGIADKAGKEFAEVMELLGRGKFLTSNRETEEALRKKYKLPALPPVDESEEEVEVAAGNAEDMQLTALNGAQVSSMIEVTKAYTDNIITRDSAIMMIMKAFNLDKEAAEVIIPKVAPIPDIKTTGTGAQFAEKKRPKKESAKQVSARITDNAEELKVLFRNGLEVIGKDIIKKLMSAYEATPDARAHSAIFKTKNTAGVNAYSKEVREAFLRITGNAYKSLDDNYTFASPKKSVNRAINKADLLVMTQENDLEKAIYLQFGTSIDSTDSISTLESDLMIAMNNQIKALEVGADISAAQLENETRMDFFDEISDEIESFTFFNSDPVSEICQALDGATFLISDPDLERYTPPLHHNCKSVMIPNLKGEKNPDATGLPSLSKSAMKSITLGEKRFCCNH